jgi:hypothetical protein
MTISFTVVYKANKDDFPSFLHIECTLPIAVSGIDERQSRHYLFPEYRDPQREAYRKEATSFHHHASRESFMVINDWIHVFAGSFILLSLAMGVESPVNPLFVSRYWLLLTAFVGANLLQYGVSKFCPLGLILKKLGVPETRETPKKA